MLLTGNPREGYLMPLRVGNQEFDVKVSTGSSNLALPGDGCFGCGANPHPYLPGTGSFDLRIKDYLGYGNGYLYGDFYVDNVHVSNFEPKPLAVMSVIASSKTMLNTETQGLPGILGIASDRAGYLSTHHFENSGNDSYMTALTEAQGLLAVQLCDSGGYIWFGTHNCSHSQAEPHFEYVTMPQATALLCTLWQHVSERQRSESKLHICNV